MGGPDPLPTNYCYKKLGFFCTPALIVSYSFQRFPPRLAKLARFSKCSIVRSRDAVHVYRMSEQHRVCTSTFSQDRLSPEKQIENFLMPEGLPGALYILVQFLLRAFPYVVKSLLQHLKFLNVELDSKTSKNRIMVFKIQPNCRAAS